MVAARNLFGTPAGLFCSSVRLPLSFRAVLTKEKCDLMRLSLSYSMRVLMVPAALLFILRVELPTFPSRLGYRMPPSGTTSCSGSTSTTRSTERHCMLVHWKLIWKFYLEET